MLIYISKLRLKLNQLIIWKTISLKVKVENLLLILWVFFRTLAIIYEFKLI